VCGILQAAVLGLAFFQTFAIAQTAERPQWNLGDKWSFRETGDFNENGSEWSREVVEKVSADRIRVKMQNGNVLMFDGQGNSRDRRGDEFTWKRFEFPLSVGKHWKHSRKIEGDSWNGVEDSSWEVKAYEKVVVPAGTFDCFRVEGTVWSNWMNRQSLNQSLNRRHEETTYWYCPEVQWAAKWRSHVQGFGFGPYTNSESVLISFQRGQP
jgi:hypothetical protein